MDQTALYAYNMEKKLISEFRSKFHEKMGYYPIIIGKASLPSENTGVMSLKELKEAFKPFLPIFGSTRLKLEGKCRKRDIVELRQIYCYIAKQMRYNLITIGDSLGGRDHTTVIHSLHSFSDNMETDEFFKDKYKMIHNHIKQLTKPLEYESSNMVHFDQVPDITESTVLPGLLSVEDQTLEHT